tara:strand:+ start:276 stop:848 length:573 start_codon:yes stop_codon:yes gene_type:complete
MEKEESFHNTYCKSIQRPSSLTDIKAWHLGESIELEKWLGCGFFNHIFVSEKDLVRVYYNHKEEEKFWNILKQKLNPDFFNEICNYFFQLIEDSEQTDSHNELFNINIKCWPAWTIFDYISKYPEIASEDIVRRLIRVRKTTEAFSYELSERLNHESSPDYYIFFKGNILSIPLRDFVLKNKILIKHGQE